MNKNSTPKKPNLIYDVGLHHGQDTDFYLKKGFDVVAFEANPEIVAVCREKFADALDAGRLTIVEGAIVENAAQAEVIFYRNKNHSLWGSTSEDWAYRSEVLGTSSEIIKVPAVDFGECLQKYGVPFYLKADIVGSEMICLRALREFENQPDYVSIRSEKVIFRRLEEEFNLFEELGYDKFKAIQQHFTDIKIPLPSSNGKKAEYEFAEGASGPFGEETAGRWKTREQVLKDYRKIFVLYWLFGDYSYLIQSERGKHFVKQLERVARRSLPSWYDTHARHSSLRV